MTTPLRPPAASPGTGPKLDYEGAMELIRRGCSACLMANHPYWHEAGTSCPVAATTPAASPGMSGATETSRGELAISLLLEIREDASRCPFCMRVECAPDCRLLAVLRPRAASPVAGMPAPCGERMQREDGGATTRFCSDSCVAADKHLGDVSMAPARCAICRKEPATIGPNCQRCDSPAPAAPAEPLRGEPRPTRVVHYLPNERKGVTPCGLKWSLSSRFDWTDLDEEPGPVTCTECLEKMPAASPSPVGEPVAEMTLEQAVGDAIRGVPHDWRLRGRDDLPWAALDPNVGIPPSVIVQAEFRRRPQPQPAPQRSRVEDVAEDCLGAKSGFRADQWNYIIKVGNRVLRKFCTDLRSEINTSTRTVDDDISAVQDRWLSGDATGGGRK